MLILQAQELLSAVEYTWSQDARPMTSGLLFRQLLFWPKNSIRGFLIDAYLKSILFKCFSAHFYEFSMRHVLEVHWA